MSIDGGHIAIRKENFMKVIIEIAVSALGSYFCGIDFSILYMLIAISVTLFDEWIHYTNDKTALQ